MRAATDGKPIRTTSVTKINERLERDTLAHYRAVWGGDMCRSEWMPDRPAPRLDTFSVYSWAPESPTSRWRYGTVGMAAGARPLELHVFADEPHDGIVEILTVVANHHRTGAPLGLGHTVRFGKPIVPGSRLDCGYVSLPYLDGPRLETAEVAGRRTSFLWLVPVTTAERDYKVAEGIEALEVLFEQNRFAYSNLHRDSLLG